MRKDVLISLLAITGAPVAALADADVVIDKTAWSGDDLTVSEDGSVTVSTGKEVSIEKELAPGKYMLQRATFTDNAKIVAVYKGKEYAPEVAFTIEGDAPAKVRVKVRAVTPGEFKFSGVKFTLIFDFAAPVKELSAQLGEIVSGTSDYFRTTDAWKKGKDGKPSLEMQVADYASQLDIIEKGDYEVYVKNHLWQGKNSPELRALTDGIAALAKVVEKANDNENAYFSAQNAYEAAEYQFRSFSSTWYTVAEEIRATYQADYNKIQQSINDFKALAREKYDAGEAKELKTAEFTENFNRMLNELEANIGVSDAAWINIYAVYQDGLRVFNAAQEEIHTQMPDDGNYADWNEEALNAMRSAWKKVSDLYKTIDADKTKASELEENFRTLKEAQVVVINATKDEYLAKHVDAEAKKAAADQLLSALEDDFQYLEKSEDVNLKYANRVKEIRTAINTLKAKVDKDYKAPHNIRTASYDADRDAIQAKISSLRSDAGAIIQNYENYQKLLKALGTETGLQKKLDDAKAAVAKMKPAAEGDTYDMAAHFQKTAAGLQKTIDEIKAAVEKGYQEKTLTETVRGDFQSQIDAAAMAVGKYQDDATAAMARYDVVNTAIKDYKGALATLRATVGTKTLVVATPATEVTGKTYGERITQLQTEIDRVAGNFSAAKEKLDADLLAALLAVQLKETILTDAQALNAAFANDKVNSDKTAKIEAAKAMYDAASKVVDAIKADIDEYKGVPYEYYNVTWTEDNLGLKYDELLQDLNDIEANANTQKAKIQAVAATEDDITEDNAVEAMSLLSVIKGDVDAINDALSELLTRVNAQKAHVNAEKQAYTDFIGNQYYYYPKGAELVSRTLTEAKNAFVIPGESIDPQIQATTTKLEALKAEAATARAKEILQESCKDSYDAEGHVVKGITSRLNDLQLEANALKAMATDSTANYNAYQKLKENFDGQKIDIWNYTYGSGYYAKNYYSPHYGFVSAFDAVRTRINQKTDGTNAAYYLGLLAYPDGVHFKEREAIKQAIEDAYKAGKAWTGSLEYSYNSYKYEPVLNKEIVRRMTDLSNVLKMIPKQAYDDCTNYKTQVYELNLKQELWDEVNGLFNASDLRPETLKPYLSQLGDLLKRIKEQKALVEKYYAEGLTTTNNSMVSEAYRSIKLELDGLKAFIEGNSDYNAVIAGDNLTRYNTFCAKADNEKWLAALEGFAYEGKDDDFKSYKDCVAKYLTPATELAAKAADGTFTGKIADLQRYINAFYAEAGAVYTSAKAKADAYDANIKNFDQLTIDYNTVTERIKAAQDYYGAFNVASSRIEANIASTFDQVKRWQADLTRQNASQEMSKRIYGLTIGEDKQWYDCHSIKILSIDGIYNAANQAEVDAIKADIVAIETQKREALDNLTGTAADEVKAYYDEHCKNLAKELDDLLKEFDENATPAEAKKDAGLLALEKKVAQARMGLIKLVNAELIEGVASSLEMLVSQAELSYSDVNITYDGVYTPVKVEYKSALDACRNELDGVKNLITSYGDEIVTYKTKVIHLLNVLIDRMGATRTDIMEANKPYVAHAKAMKDLQNAYDALVAEQTRVKELIASYQHASEVREYSDWEGLGEMFYFEGGKSYMENYEKQFFNEASEKAEVVSDVLEQAAKTLEEGPVSAILTDNQVESYKDGCLNEAYAKLATVEAFGAWKETQSVYQVNVNSARYAMENSFNKSGTNIYDEDNTLWEQFNNLERACQNFDNYRNFVDIYRILPTKDINGNAWLNPDGSEAWQKEINYSKDEEYGVKLVAATSESLVESMNALRTSIEENTYVLGDVTEDGVVLTDDYLAVLNALLDPETLEGGKVFAAADVNRDGKISIADVTLIAAKVTNGLWPSLGGTLNAPMVGSENLTVSAEDNNGVQRIAINLENRKDYVACQMDIILPAGMTVVGESVGNRANGHALYSKDIDGVHRVVISTIENNSFTNGSAILYLDVQGGSIDKVALDKVIFAEANGRETTITGSDATGISGMEAEGSLKQKIYTVGGQLLDKVKQGINIVRNANGKTQKVTGK